MPEPPDGDNAHGHRRRTGHDRQQPAESLESQVKEGSPGEHELREAVSDYAEDG